MLCIVLVSIDLAADASLNQGVSETMLAMLHLQTLIGEHFSTCYTRVCRDERRRIRRSVA